MSVKILFAPKQPPAVLDIARSLVPPGYELVVADVGTPEFIEAAADAEFYLGLARRMGGEFFRSAPKLRLVQLLSAGYDHVDVEAARKAGVPVANNGGANAIAVAEHTLMLILAVLKRLVRFHNDVVAGRWRVADPADARVGELAGRTVGLIGLGRWRGVWSPATPACSTTTSGASARTRRTRSGCASRCSTSSCAARTW
jgi:glyoxylate reductase/D-3-phosphoglycerate dehydrogenase